MTEVRTCLWMDGTGEAAAEFYCSLLPDSQIESRVPVDPSAEALIVNFRL